MKYLLFTLIALFSVSIIGFFSARMGVADFGKKLKIYKPCEDDDFVPYKRKTLILITTICFAVLLAVQISLYINTNIIGFIKLYGLMLIVLTAGLIDYKKRIIPNLLILIGLIFRASIYIYEIFFTESIKPIIINDLIGFAIGFVFLGLISIITKGALGFGDAKLFGIIGIITGAFCTYSTLLISLLLSVIFSVVSITLKKMGRKDSFPFGPCIAVGYTITVLLASY